MYIYIYSIYIDISIYAMQTCTIYISCCIVFIPSTVIIREFSMNVGDFSCTSERRPGVNVLHVSPAQRHHCTVGSSVKLSIRPCLLAPSVLESMQKPSSKQGYIHVGIPHFIQPKRLGCNNRNQKKLCEPSLRWKISLWSLKRYFSWWGSIFKIPLKALGH